MTMPADSSKASPIAVPLKTLHMSAFGPWRTCASAPHMSAFGVRANIAVNAEISACDPKRTSSRKMNSPTNNYTLV